MTWRTELTSVPHSSAPARAPGPCPLSSLETAGGGRRPRARRHPRPSHPAWPRLSPSSVGSACGPPLWAPFRGTSAARRALAVSVARVCLSLPPPWTGPQPAGLLCPRDSQASILERFAVAFFGALPYAGIEPASPAWRVCRLRSPGRC